MFHTRAGKVEDMLLVAPRYLRPTPARGIQVAQAKALPEAIVH